MWLQPSFFWMGDLQLAQDLELVSNHRQLAASSYSTLTPATETERDRNKDPCGSTTFLIRFEQYFETNEKYPVG